MLTLTKEEERVVIVARLQKALAVPRLQARFVELFTVAPQGIVSQDSFAREIYDSAPTFDSDNLLKSMACRVRPVLARVLGVQKRDVFETLYGRGYRMDAENVAALRAHLGMAPLTQTQERTP